MKKTNNIGKIPEEKGLFLPLHKKKIQKRFENQILRYLISQSI